ncbi:hypothetical protein THIX_30716 [Thiomonas sp. X19]|nr:hypothetical protein THIX_30716 [Thiomonas sp. X19]
MQKTKRGRRRRVSAWSRRHGGEHRKLPLRRRHGVTCDARHGRYAVTLAVTISVTVGAAASRVTGAVTAPSESADPASLANRCRSRYRRTLSA